MFQIFAGLSDSRQFLSTVLDPLVYATHVRLTVAAAENVTLCLRLELYGWTTNTDISNGKCMFRYVNSHSITSITVPPSAD